MATSGAAASHQTPITPSSSPPAQPLSMSDPLNSSVPPAPAQAQHQPVEMSNLDTLDHTTTQPTPAEGLLTAAEPEAHSAVLTSTSGSQTEPAPATATQPPTAKPTTRPRQESSAIGPPSETGAPVGLPDAAGPTVLITLLLPSTGTRHPFKIDSRYLKRRNVAVSSPSSPALAEAVDTAADVAAGEPTAPASDGEKSIDPWEISVYTVKELIWRDWRDEWELRPTSPSAIRLIHFGRLLDDKSALKDLKFNATLPNMIHMSVKPADLDDDEAGGKLAKISSRTSHPRARRGNHNHAEANAEQSERPSPGCRCLVM